MPVVSARFSTVPGTEAAEGRTGEHAVIVDRPDGVAGGQGRGFNGGQLLALAVGGCLCNDVRYVAHAHGIDLGPVDIAVDVHIDEGNVTHIDATVHGTNQAALAAVFEEAAAISTIVRAVTNGAPVNVSMG